MTDLFTPVRLGPYVLPNRIVLPPLTRNRASADFVPTPRMATYYAQRASAGLLIAEGAAIAPTAVAYPRVPGIWNDEQTQAWHAITDAVHAGGGVIFLQLWHVGRVSHSSTQPGGQLPVAPSPVAVRDATIYTTQGPQPFEIPRELNTDEVRGVVNEYGRAARNAAAAGFDGVEIHAANGYLIDQFLNDNVNRRADEYGGGIPNRIRFLIEVVAAVSAVWGSGRVGVRMSPSGTFMDCRDSDKRALYTAAVSALAERQLAYLHLVEPTVAGGMSVEAAPDAIPTSWFRDIYPGTLVVAGGHTFETGTKMVQGGSADLVGFGRAFIANPDLPDRFRSGVPLAEADPHTYYSSGDEGYLGYPMHAGDGSTPGY